MASDTERPAFHSALVACVQVTDFKHGKQWPIMIVSYETLRKFADGLAGFCDVLICDEGHRFVATWQRAKCPHPAHCYFHGSCIITHVLTISTVDLLQLNMLQCAWQSLPVPHMFAFAFLCLGNGSRS